jgi:hypothetical protein
VAEVMPEDEEPAADEAVEMQPAGEPLPPTVTGALPLHQLHRLLHRLSRLLIFG